MLSIKWLPEAKIDLERLYEFIKPHSQNAAAKAILILVEAVNSLKKFPEKGRPWQADTAFRELPVIFGSKGYVIRYRLHKEQIIIVRVWHSLEDR